MIDRQRRCGYPEVIFAPGKSVETLIQIVMELIARGQDVLVTRLETAQAEPLAQQYPDGIWNARARTFRRMADQSATTTGRIAVVTAGTSDIPVAEEAALTASPIYFFAGANDLAALRSAEALSVAYTPFKG